MELDVHITRERDEPWGFELIGGADFEIPLTVDKVLPSSPAHHAGLQPGDVVARLGDKLATELSLEAAQAIVAEAIGSISFGICRGLYDPVLDNYEPIYEPIERADSDLPSEPTEVLDPLRDLSLDDPNILDPRVTDPSLWDSGYATRPVTESRSLTASPFVPNSKPYRPFSTEPFEVPPLDDPIILNPCFKDTFNVNRSISKNSVQVLNSKDDDLLRLLPLDSNIEPKFKLPISEKYDPDWDKKVKSLLKKCAEGGRRESQKDEPELVDYSNKLEVETESKDNTIIEEFKTTKEYNIQDGIPINAEIAKEEIKRIETSQEEFEVLKIEQTALEIVGESIELAISVTEDIKKEIEEELRSSMTRELCEEKKYKTNIETEDDTKSKLIELSLQEGKKLEDTIKVNALTEKQTLETGLEGTCTSDSVRKESSANENKNSEITETHERDEKTHEETKEVNNVEQSVTFKNEDAVSTKKVESRKISQAEEVYLKQHESFTYPGLSTNVTMNSEGKQKAYMIGLQTIPHIKGFVQSSYHFDLLLRTFFIHLTDVMVALSRFILTQPAQELETKAETVIKEKLIKEFTSQDLENNQRKETVHKPEEIMQSVKEIKQQEKDVTKDMKTQQELKEIKSQQQTKYSKEAKEIQDEKHESQKLEKLKSQTIFSEKQVDLEINVEEHETRKKSGVEMAQRTQRKSRDLTNKMDAVISEFETKTGIEDRLEVTEKRERRSRSKSQIEEEVMKESDPLEWLDKRNSRQSSQEKTDVSTKEKGFYSYLESKETKKSEIKKETTTTKTKPGKQTYVAIVESHVYTNENAILEDQVAEMSETASVQSSEEINAALESFEVISSEKVAMNNIVRNEEKQQAVELLSNVLQEVVQEKQEVLEAIIDLKSQEKEATNIINEQQAVSKQEILASVASETTEIVDESKLDSFETQATVSHTAIITSDENYMKTAQNSIEMILEASQKEITENKVNKQQAFTKVESLAIAVAESTDVVVDDSKIETFESQKLASETANISTEETYKKAAVGITEVTFEIAEDKHSDVAKTCEVTVKEENQHLAVAGIIETKTEFCKEPKIPPEDENASLKIVKYQVVEDDKSTDIILQSELNIQQSLDVTLSSQQVQSISETSCYSASHESSSVQKASKLVKESSSVVNESSTSIKESMKSAKSLHIDTNLTQLNRQTSDQCDENNNTPTPTTVPSTPLTDEYVFKLEIPLPKNQGTVVIEESPDREDPHIVKKGLIPYIETTIEDQIIYDPPLPTPPEDKVTAPVYTKPGLRGGAQPIFRKEYIREIERKSSLLASAIDETIKSIEEYKEEVGIDTTSEVTLQLPKKKSADLNDVTFLLPNKSSQKVTNSIANGDHKEVDNAAANGTTEGETDIEMPPGFKPVTFNPEAYQARLYEEVTRGLEPTPTEVKPYTDASGEPLGTVQGIVDGLEDATVDEEVSKELGKPGLTEDKIAVLISGESEMLREAHVMGLTRVLTSHMTRADDSSVDFQKIKPLVPSLKDSEVVKALNEEMKRECEERKKKENAVDAKKYTTFLQKPKRPVPRQKFGSHGYVEPEEEDNEKPYKVKIVRQPKPKVAPDYKPEDFETGPLPWEQRALNEPVPSPVPPEEPILVPEEAQFFEAVDPLPESEVPDLEDTGIPLPPTPPPVPPSDLPPDPVPPEVETPEPPEPIPEVPVEPTPAPEMDQNKMAEQLVNTVKGMVDPNAPLEKQLSQMRAQLAALAQLPCVIQQSLEVLTRQLSSMSRQENQQVTYSYDAQMNSETQQDTLESMPAIQEYQEQPQICAEVAQNGEETQNSHEVQKEELNMVTIEEIQEETISAEEAAALKREQDALIEEQKKSEKEKKERQENARLDQESRQVKQRAPRVGKPRPAFGPLTPEERPLVLPGGRRWRGPKDAYNDQFIAETLTSQSEIIQGKVMGYESDRLPYDDRINFMKWEKPPVTLDHLQNSATYKLIHNLEDAPLKRTDLLTPVVAESDYRQRCRSTTPNMQANGRM